MKVQRISLHLNNYPWLRKIIHGNSRYFEFILGYVTRAFLEPGDEEKIRNRKYELAVGDTGETVTHETTIHVFFHYERNDPYSGTYPAEHSQKLEGDKTLRWWVDHHMKAQGKVCDAYVIQAEIRSSRVGLLSDTYRVIIPEGSALANRMEHRVW